MTRLSRARRAALVVLATAVATAVPASSASAHVTVSSIDVTAGGSGTLTFRVPNESDTASTVGLSIELPLDPPFRSVRAETKPGWTATVERIPLDEPVQVGETTITEAVGRVTFTADGSGIGPDEYGLFAIRVGAFPEEGGTFHFPAAQTYSDGEVVDWAEIAAAGEEEPAHPAPVLDVAPGDGEPDDDHGHGVAGSDGAGAPPASGSDSTARTLGVIGIVLGALGVAAGLFLGRRQRPAVSPA